MADKSWDKLPFEILLRIFEYAALAPSEFPRLMWHQMSYLKSYQTVCRGWSRAAQKLLYQKVKLGKSTPRFVRTITVDATHLATLVKEVICLPALMGFIDCSIHMESIFENCSQIEVLLITTTHIEEMILPWLLMDNVSTKNLKVIRNGPLRSFSNQALYAVIVLKARKSLTDLAIDLCGQNRRMFVPGVGYRQIIKRLNEFSSMRNLDITTCTPPTYKIFDKVINDCSRTLESLKVAFLEMHEWRGELDNIVLNYTIKKLKIESFQMDEFSMLYLNHKFKALDDLQIGLARYKAKQKENKQDFWSPMIYRFLATANASIRIRTKEFEFEFIVEKCLEILLKTGCNQRHFQVLFEIDHPDVTRSEILTSHEVELKKSQSGRVSQCGIYITIFSIRDRDKCLRKFSSWMQLFRPDSICLNGFDPMQTFYDVFTDDIWPICPSRQVLIDLKEKSDIKRFLTKTCNINSWNIFNSILSDTRIETIDIKSMALPNISPVDLDGQQNSIIQCLLFNNSILNIFLFPELSKRLPALDRFTLDSNSYLMSDKHTLQIFMPSTTVEEFSLVVRSGLGNLYSIDHRPTKVTNDKSVVGNYNLNVAMATGVYTLKIETSSKTLISSRNEDVEIIENSKDVVHGIKNKVLIWLKFKGLKKFRIGDQKSIDLKTYELFE